MATIKAILNKQYKDKDGTYQVVIRITHSSKRKLFNTTYRSTEAQWDDENGLVKKNHPEYLKANAKIETMVADAKKYKHRCIFDGIPFNFNQIYTKSKVDKSLSDYMKKMMDDFLEKGKFDSYCKIRTARNQLLKALGKEKIYYTDINKQVILKIDQYLIGEKNSALTRKAKFETLKTCWKKAVKWDNAPKENPFEFYEPEKGKVKKREWLTLEEIKMLENYVPTGVWIQRKQKQWAVDMFLVSYYCRGIRFKNILFMKKADVRGGLVHFVNAKGNQDATSKLNPVLEKIFARNNNPNSEYFFIDNPKKTDEKSLNELKSNRNYRGNKGLEKAMKELKIKKKIRFHSGRHTFSNNLLQIGTSTEKIQGLLLHTRVSTTAHYLEGFQHDILHDVMDNLYALTKDSVEIK